MNPGVFDSPGLTVALAMSIGMLAQSAAHHLRIPGIVLLLAAGVALGPDGFRIIQPASLGGALFILTECAVAVILFEGGMNLKIARLRRAQQAIRRLILYGSMITVAGGAAAAHWILDWPWRNALLFGTLVMVTGPTVINPLLKRLNVKRSVATILEAEGVLIDAVGAVVATVALEAALSPDHGGFFLWGWHVISRLGLGAAMGALAALVLIWLFRVRRLIPEGTENVLVLSMVLALFQISNALLTESGIAAVTAAGIVMGHFSTPALRDILEFKEELTVLLIGMLFVLLAADVRLAQVANLGIPGLLVVLALMALVRPVAVFAGMGFSEPGWKERLFISWIGPRGIVAAAVSSLFAAILTERGLAGGGELRALVFLVIAVTVVVAGLTGGPVAAALGLRRPSHKGWVILGANPLARAIARVFKENGQEILCIDSNADHCTAAEADCTRVIYGNGIASRTLLRAEIDTRRGALALTANDEVNYLFLRKVKEETRHIALYAAHKTDTATLTARMINDAGAEVLFAVPVDVELWERRFNSGEAVLATWRPPAGPAPKPSNGSTPALYPSNGSLVGVAVRRNGRLAPLGNLTRLKAGDAVHFFMFAPELAASEARLTEAGWQRTGDDRKEVFSTSSCQLDSQAP